MHGQGCTALLDYYIHVYSIHLLLMLAVSGCGTYDTALLHEWSGSDLSSSMFQDDTIGLLLHNSLKLFRASGDLIVCFIQSDSV